MHVVQSWLLQYSVPWEQEIEDTYMVRQRTQRVLLASDTRNRLSRCSALSFPVYVATSATILFFFVVDEVR